MPSIPLQFVPPDNPNLDKLKIWEGATADGLFDLIETVDDIGTYPDWIREYTSTLATDPVNNWFAISWIDNEGATSDLSVAVKGGTQTMVGKIVKRVLLRRSTLDDNIVQQTAEYVMSTVLNVEDPYSVTSLTYKQTEGLTLLTLARSILHSAAVGGGAGSYTAGLVSQKSESEDDLRELITWLLSEANLLLGITNTYVMLLADIDPLGLGGTSAIDYDQSRLLITEIP